MQDIENACVFININIKQMEKGIIQNTIYTMCERIEKARNEGNIEVATKMRTELDSFLDEYNRIEKRATTLLSQE